MKKDNPDKNKKLEESLLDSMGEKDLKRLKMEFPNKWKYLTKKLASPYEFFNCIEEYQNYVDSLKREYLFSILKNNCPDDDEIRRTKRNN